MEEERKHKKLVWSVVIIIAVLIAAAFAVYYLRLGIVSPTGYRIFPPSDTISSIEADLGAMDFSDLDKELSDIEKELAQ